MFGRVADIINHAKLQVNGLRVAELRGPRIAILHWLEVSPLQQRTVRTNVVYTVINERAPVAEITDCYDQN